EPELAPPGGGQQGHRPSPRSGPRNRDGADGRPGGPCPGGGPLAAPARHRERERRRADVRPPRLDGVRHRAGPGDARRRGARPDNVFPEGPPREPRRMTRRTVLFAPDSFKGSLTSVQVARALAVGWSRGRPEDEIEHAPLGDGGEGSIHAIAFAGGWDWVQATVAGPLGTDVNAGWLRSDDGSRAFVELAEASGLSRVAPATHDPIRASTRGTGQLLEKAIDAGIRGIILGIGGSATTDGALGILEALGARDDGTELDLTGLDPRLADVELEIACDVSNPLLGATGAAATYGPQKGATPAQVGELDDRLRRWADRLERATGRRERD